MGTLAPVPAIRGREAETAILSETLDQVESGRWTVALIEGEPGIGKTRLLDAALEDARRRGLQVAVGRAEELERTRPFGVMADAFGCARSSPDPRRAAIGELLAAGGDGAPDPITVTSDPGLRFRVVDALADLVEELALPGPLVIGVDDLQWADPSSLLTLDALSRRVEYLPVGLIACFRPSPRPPELDRLAASLASAGGRRLSLGGLTEQAVTDLVTDAVAARPGRGLLAGLAGAAGNPLFVTEMLAALAQEGLIETAGGRAEVAQVILPPTLRLTILRRLSFLADDTLHALRAAAILGSGFTITDLSVTMARPVGLMSSADPSRDRLLADRAGGLMLAGRIPDAVAACRQLLDRHHDPGTDGPVRISLGHALLAQGQLHDALQQLERAGQSPALSDAERGAAQAWAGFARISLGDLAGAAALAEQARSAAASAGDHQTISIVMSTEARISESRGHLQQALEIAEEAVRRADQSPGRLGHRFPVCVTRGRILIELDRPQEARSALGAGLRTCEELGVRWALATHQLYLAYGRFLAGEWDDAIAELEASLKLAEEIGEIYSLGYAHGLLSRISLHRNDLSRAREAAAAADRNLIGWGAGHSMTWVAWPRALILEAGGEPGRALATMAGLWDWCVSSGLTLECLAIGPDLVRLALAADDLGRARQVSGAVAGAASGHDVAWMTGEALRCQGLVEDDPEILQAAADAHARGSRPLGTALACEDAGRAFARQGHAERARPLLDQAVRSYERLGAARDLARAEATLREAGIRRGRRGPRRRPQFGWPSLTPTEHTVADLVAEGLSNPQIGERLYISHRTVQTHLAHIFAKLDISARTQLAAEVTRHGNHRPFG